LSCICKRNINFYAQKNKLFKCRLCNLLKAVKRGIRREKQIFYCGNCEKYFSKPVKRINSGSRKIFLDHLEGISYRKLEKRCGINKKKLCKTVNELAENFKDNFDITKQFLNQLKYAGNLVLDGKYVPVKEIVSTDVLKIFGKIPKSKKRRKVVRGKILIWGADWPNHDIPNFEFGDSENGFVFNKYFYKLKSIGYPLISLTVDDEAEVIRAAKRHFPDCVIQLCVKHYLAKINKILSIRNIRIKINARENQIEKLFSGNESECIPATRFYSIKTAARLFNEISELRFKYELLLDFQEIIISILAADNYQIAVIRIESLEKYFWPKRFKMAFPKQHKNIVKKLMADFRESREYLLSYLEHPRLRIPNTTNLIEGYNSQLELRLSSIRGFESETTAKNYINAWIIKRRFSKFTDCKKHFKSLNGKSPIKCAGADISNVRNWIKLCQI